MSEILSTDLALLGPDFFEEGDSFEVGQKKSSGLRDDVIVAHVPELAFIDFADFERVIAMRPKKGNYGSTKDKGYSLHPLSGKWKCPRCGRFNLNIVPQRQWLRCAGSQPRNGLTLAGMPCDAPPIDLWKADDLLFQALETFGTGRKGNFAAVARERYDEVLRGARIERQLKKENAEKLRSEIRLASKELAREQVNRHVRAALQEEADRLGDELDKLEADLQDMPAEIDDPDPEGSLLELNNMIEHIRMTTPFGFAVNADALQFRNRLHNVIMCVTMVEKGEDLYDVEFQFNGSAALDQPGQMVELVRFADQNLKAGRFRERRKQVTIKQNWDDGRYAISTRAWKTRPSFPLAERMFGKHLRWMVDTMIMTAETGMGTRGVVRLAGEVVPNHTVQTYRSTKECEDLQAWLQEVRPRKHGYGAMKPRRASAHTLRHRMELVDHPMIHLNRCALGAPPGDLTDEEWDRLVPRIPEMSWYHRPAMRERIGETIEMLRCNSYANRSNKVSYRIWLNYQIKRGTFLTIVNFLRELEGLPAVASLPVLPLGSRWKKAAAQ